MTAWLDAAVGQAAADSPVESVAVLPTVPGRMLLVDGDYAAYFCSGNDDTSPGEARGRLLDRIRTAMGVSGAERTVMHLTGSASTKGDRYLIAKTWPYQGQRNGHHPKNWSFLREYLEGYREHLFKTKIWNSREADDGCAYHAKFLGWNNAVLHSRDKDFRMIPGIHLDWITYEIVEVPPGAWEVLDSTGKVFGRKWFYLQLLQGDAADKIPGVQKILSHTGKMVACGESRANTILANVWDEQEAADIVLHAYKKFYGDDQGPVVLAEQAMLLWMRDDQHALADNVRHHMPLDLPYHLHLERVKEAYAQANL